MPLFFLKQDFLNKILSKFDIKNNGCVLKEWEGLVSSIGELKKEVKIGIVGKYFDIGDFTLEDSYISVIEAVKHASWNLSLKPRIEWIDSKGFEKDPKLLESLKSYDGVIVPGGFGCSGVEGKISAIKYCRERGIPYLGLCYGMHLAVVDFARNVCGMDKANTTEADSKTKYPVIDILPEQVELLKKKKYGATMRLGKWPANLKKGSLVHSLYGKDRIEERHRHRYEVNPKFIGKLEAGGIVFSGASPDRKLMEFMEIPKHTFFVATQAHPEFTSGFLKPNPVFAGFIRAAGKK
jgi:CTP synthase